MRVMTLVYLRIKLYICVDYNYSADENKKINDFVGRVSYDTGLGLWRLWQ